MLEGWKEVEDNFASCVLNGGKDDGKMQKGLRSVWQDGWLQMNYVLVG